MNHSYLPRTFLSALTLVAAAIACHPARPHTLTEGKMWPFDRKIAIQTQLQQLASAGITMNPEVTEADLFSFESKEQLEAKPYNGLVLALAIDIEREPFTPIADRLWLCDYERIEDHGDYRAVLERLQRMTANTLRISEVEDYVDVEAGEAWLQFTFRDAPVRWEFQVDDDWLDPEIFLNYDELLKGTESGLRLYSNHTDYGQSALIGAFRKKEKAKFDELSDINLTLISLQR